MRITDEMIEKYLTYSERRERVIFKAQELKNLSLLELNGEYTDEEGKQFYTMMKRTHYGSMNAFMGFALGFVCLFPVILVLLLPIDRSSINWGTLGILVPAGLLFLSMGIWYFKNEYLLQRRIKRIQKKAKAKGASING